MSAHIERNSSRTFNFMHQSAALVFESLVYINAASDPNRAVGDHVRSPEDMIDRHSWTAMTINQSQLQTEVSNVESKQTK